MRRIGVDVGGTFTDLIYIDDEAGQVIVHKTPSTPADPSIGTVQGISELCAMAGIEPAQLDQVFHGTTVATNIVIEHNGAKVGMITTKGYRDILHIARHKKPMNFSLWQNLPWQAQPIVRRRFRLTVDERIDKNGDVLIPLDDDEVRAQVRRLKREKVEAVSVCLLFSFLNPEHEQRVAAIVREEFPEAFLSVSSEVIPQYREYERFSTVGLNAYVGPKVSNYIGRFDAALRKMKVRSGIHLMTSAAGVATPEGAMEKPVNLLMSGPIAGVVGGIWTGRQSNETNVITLDVGGTSADIGLAQDGKLRMKHLLDTKVGPYQAMIPMVDVDTIGAGGGSIAYIDPGGIFRVGPRSAGADPGPVAYNRGGTEPTATDAMVVLGWLRPELFLGGKMELREDLARAAIDKHLASKLGTSIEDAAMGVYRILAALDGRRDRAGVGAQGLRPARVRARRRGRRRAALRTRDRARGGRQERARAELSGHHRGARPAHDGHGLRVRGDLVCDGLGAVQGRRGPQDARQAVQEARGRGARAVQARRHRPQEGAATSTSPRRATRGRATSCASTSAPGAIDAAWIDAMKAAFHDIHEREYSRRFEDADVQIANVRVRAVGLMPGLDAPQVKKGKAAPPAGALKLTADAWFRVNGKLKKVETAFYERTELVAGNVIEGPAIITQFDSTTRRPAGLLVQGRPCRQPRHHLLQGRSAGRGTRTLRGRGSPWLICLKSVSLPAPHSASGSTSTRSRCACSAARSTPSPRRWRASCSA